MRFLNWLRCFLGHHDWTCAAAEGVKPTPAQLAGGMAGFKDYATMYCKRCGRISELNDGGKGEA
jgi:hypothetical protein